MSCCLSNKRGYHCDCKPCGRCVAEDREGRLTIPWLYMAVLSAASLLFVLLVLAVAIHFGGCSLDVTPLHRTNSPVTETGIYKDCENCIGKSICVCRPDEDGGR